MLFAFNPNDVRPGWGALLLVLILCAVTYLLWRSMNAQLRRIKVPPSRPPRPEIPSAEAPPEDETEEQEHTTS
jgi:hypothetical protein